MSTDLFRLSCGAREFSLPVAGRILSPVKEDLLPRWDFLRNHSTVRFLFFLNASVFGRKWKSPETVSLLYCFRIQNPQRKGIMILISCFSQNLFFGILSFSLFSAFGFWTNITPAWSDPLPALPLMYRYLRDFCLIHSSLHGEVTLHSKT